MVIMIIKGLFRRYERWNPVHPTSGAFWGMGVGVGCGVGWGPGFGPEVIGYVGAGCGIGFSVGLTLAGFGIGLPANQMLQAPLKAVLATRDGAWTLARSNCRLSDKGGWGDGWSGFPSAVSHFQRESIERMAGFCASEEGLAETRNKLVASTNSVMNGLGAFWSQIFRSRKGRA